MEKKIYNFGGENYVLNCIWFPTSVETFNDVKGSPTLEQVNEWKTDKNFLDFMMKVREVTGIGNLVVSVSIRNDRIIGNGVSFDIVHTDNGSYVSTPGYSFVTPNETFKDVVSISLEKVA